ncbi:FAS1-like dehydratase domain-containing protein [Mycolicibacterium thermoresistibile]|nr:MaoC family dehydratase N-terminal domain-containing protein [Mycolicibacterium thermoresistibile]MCV7189170.1 MaoC family dehydratase N-terminal domain-containing protein [Mycolicibacterium thermoresistibile]GAT14640.1 putative uncharacterized protein [Mycolicibacterium thermoresistibile]
MITDRLADAVGVWHEEGPPSFPIDRSDIRRWAIATYWPEEPPRLYWDEEYAKTTRWGGLIAPADFNPFAWPVTRGDDGPSALVMPAPGEPGQRMLNGGVAFQYGVPMRPGDVIRGRWRIKDATERAGRLGQMLYIRLERQLHNQHDEWVRTRVDTLIRY